jgi:pyruvate formate lyase activating enzyme
MGVCKICGREERTVSSALALCRYCIVSGKEGVEERIAAVHRFSRRRFGLPEDPPADSRGIDCPLCANACRAAEGERGFCAVRRNEGGRWTGARASEGYVSWYHDALPTNCVASWICPAGTDVGYPRYTDTHGHERGFLNLAVFYESCSFNCLFCQNWHFRNASRRSILKSPDELAQAVDARTRCICFFGGDPSTQLAHALRATRAAVKSRPGGILRICWETNGALTPRSLPHIAGTVLPSGGCVKFDIKALDETLHRALTGRPNRHTLDAFRGFWRLVRHRPDPSPLTASTLLVPGYVTPDEVERIARFVASVDRDIPYSLLAFHPQFEMNDLPITSSSHAAAALEAAESAGLRRVRLGNVHLL